MSSPGKDWVCTSEIFVHLMAPQIGELGREDPLQAAPALDPLLGVQQPDLDGLPHPDLVGQDGTHREGALERERGGCDEMGAEVHLRIRQSRSQLHHTVRGAAPGELMSQVVGVEVGHPSFQHETKAGPRQVRRSVVVD